MIKTLKEYRNVFHNSNSKPEIVNLQLRKVSAVVHSVYKHIKDVGFKRKGMSDLFT